MKIQRRDVIAAGGLAAFAAGFSQTLGRMADAFAGPADGRHQHYGAGLEPEFRVDPATGELTPNPDQQVSYTGCMGCTTLCGVRVRIDKATGKILRVGGNPYSPLSTEPHLPMKATVKESFVALSRFQDKGLAGRSTTCGRGNAALAQIDSPFRVLTPLKRVGPRNSGQWEPISFEQLVKEVVEGGDLFGEGHVDGLRALRDLKTPIDPDNPAYGPRVNQVGHIVSVNDGRDLLGRRFWQQAYGTQNYVGHGSYCGGAYRSGSGALFGDHRAMPHAKPDLANAEFVLFIGTAPGNAGNPFKRTGKMLAHGRTDGRLEYVVVDPVLTNADNRAAAERGRWVPIRPGTDGALVMAMMRWLFENGRVHTAYLANPSLAVAEARGEPSFTTASWLVIAEPGHPRDGRCLRGSDIGLAAGRQGTLGEADPYLVMGEDGRPLPVSTATAPAPLDVDSTVDLGGKAVRVRTGYALLRESALAKTLDEYAAACGVPVEVITGLADEFSSHGRRACAVAHGGMMSGAGFYNAYAVVTLNALIGNLNWKGGFAMNGGGFPHVAAGPRYDLVNFPGKIQPKGTPLGRNVPYERTAEFARKRDEGKAYPARDQWFPGAPGLATEFFSSAFEGYPYGLKALVLWMANPVYGIPGLKERFGKDLADPQKLPLIISIDPLINESNAYADYIVPDTLMYESWGWTTAWNGVPTKMLTARWPVVEPRLAKTPDGQPICMETFVFALARAMDLPGFGPEGLADAEGNRLPLERPEDWYLRAGANAAYAGQPVADASDEDMALTGVARIRPALEAVLKPEEWRKVALLYTRGGRYQPANQAQDANNPEWQAQRFAKPLWIWSEHVGGAKNALTGKRYSGCATWQEPAFADGTPMRAVHTESDWPLLAMSFKSALQSAHSIATPITGLHPENALVVHPEDAAARELATGDQAWLATPGGRVKCTVLVHHGVMRGVVAVEHGFGHRELGARPHRIGGQSQPDRPQLAAGININDLGLVDPTRGGRNVWVDAVSGTSVRNGLPARLEKA
ncbi:molybdopterin dinucleotide binding domain-containing protein [Pseudothauera rhizosphaerae]|uniref:Tetrathionate reductase subunit TtrA n=1 Tax=Pseudothauera rhizosphaerae TaxID=2565932 RepID=A0A4S4ATV7_9RHOO|nr:molybdopterin dinucleotide binding domain-containing protein [Pseudothauera rhizosphaerae]THF63351.1 tetrathionate reductase subunit TtrA [Pseudothauera rhizosphaerae]